ncbi:hypothetical protein EVAR_5511_1 [Eumeta japonica]|uniref:Uncharacterized protein n=1 Tax=Eumeta variegata TaxID=151549 RepID=A0A4C1TBI6_EUMVA|nr:hypothetical protein EVAR_5511_1 [Eumeta japonica]
MIRGKNKWSKIVTQWYPKGWKKNEREPTKKLAHAFRLFELNEKQIFRPSWPYVTSTLRPFVPGTTAYLHTAIVLQLHADVYACAHRRLWPNGKQYSHTFTDRLSRDHR